MSLSTFQDRDRVRPSTRVHGLARKPASNHKGIILRHFKIHKVWVQKMMMMMTMMCIGISTTVL